MSNERNQGPLSGLSQLAGPLKWIGTGICALAVLILVGGTIAMLASGEDFDVGIIPITGVMFAIGLAIRVGAAKLTGEMPALDMFTVGGWLFMAVGGVMVLGGIAMVFDDPAGFALMAFGAVFLGVGFGAWKFLGAPEGKKVVYVQDYQAGIRTRDGRTGTRTSDTIIYVDEDADEAEIAAASAEHAAARLEVRDDWVSGRIEAQDQRRGNMVYVAAGVWGGFALLMVVLALLLDEFFWIVAVIAGLITVGLIVYAVRAWLHRRKYTDSHCVLETVPLRLGEAFRAEIESGIAKGTPPADAFEVSLECVHRWEETRGTGSDRRTRQRRDVLWREDARANSKVSARHPTVLVPVAFTPPADRPPAAPKAGGEGIYWELRAHAAMPGLDWEATFQLPILAPPEGE